MKLGSFNQVKSKSGIYFASKVKHAEKWRKIRAKGLPVISTWIDEAGEGETSDFSDLWVRCVREASSAQALILYAEPEDVLKGAFIEVGAAIASEVPVYVVGRQPRWTWCEHPLVTECNSIEAALLKWNPAMELNPDWRRGY